MVSNIELIKIKAVKSPFHLTNLSDWDNQGLDLKFFRWTRVGLTKT